MRRTRSVSPSGYIGMLIWREHVTAVGSASDLARTTDQPACSGSIGSLARSRAVSSGHLSDNTQANKRTRQGSSVSVARRFCAPVANADVEEGLAARARWQGSVAGREMQELSAAERRVVRTVAATEPASHCKTGSLRLGRTGPTRSSPPRHPRRVPRIQAPGPLHGHQDTTQRQHSEGRGRSEEAAAPSSKSLSRTVDVVVVPIEDCQLLQDLEWPKTQSRSRWLSMLLLEWLWKPLEWLRKTQPWVISQRAAESWCALGWSRAPRGRSPPRPPRPA